MRAARGRRAAATKPTKRNGVAEPVMFDRPAERELVLAVPALEVAEGAAAGPDRAGDEHVETGRREVAALVEPGHRFDQVLDPLVAGADTRSTARVADRPARDPRDGTGPGPRPSSPARGCRTVVGLHPGASTRRAADPRHTPGPRARAPRSCARSPHRRSPRASGTAAGRPARADRSRGGPRAG